MSTFAYFRVSTLYQDLQKNKNDILHLANDKQLGYVEWVEEKASGRISWKHRAIGDLIEKMQPEETLIVRELSRLDRSMLECIEILSVAAQKTFAFTSSKITGSWTVRSNPKSWR